MYVECFLLVRAENGRSHSQFCSSLMFFFFLGAPSSAFVWSLASAGRILWKPIAEVISFCFWSHRPLIELVRSLDRSQGPPSGPAAPRFGPHTLSPGYFLVLPEAP